MKVVYFRNVFIDTETNAVGNGQKSRISFPPSAFSIRPNQIMKLVLTSFEQRRNWYSINSTNNTFYLYNAGAYTQIQISPGSYRTFDGGADSLATAIEAAVDTALGVATTTVSWSEITRKFTITQAAIPAGAYFVCFQVKQKPPAPVGVSTTGYFNDISEILGAKPTRDGWGPAPVNAFGTSTGPAPHTSPYVGALNTIETIFIRTNLQTNNYQSYGFEKNLPDAAGLTASSIFARIPLSRAHYDDTFEIIQFEDTNDLFSILLQQTQLSDMVFSITDHAGRPLAEVSQGQANDGNLSYKMSFRWEVIEQDVPQGEYRVRPPGYQSMRVDP